MRAAALSLLFRGRLTVRLGLVLLLVALVPHVARADQPDMHPVAGPFLFGRVLAKPVQRLTTTPAKPEAEKATDIDNQSLFSRLVEADDPHIYGMLFNTGQLMLPRLAARPRPLISMQAPHSVTLSRNTITLARAPPALGIDKSPILGQVEQVVLDVVPVLMLMVMVGMSEANPTAMSSATYNAMCRFLACW